MSSKGERRFLILVSMTGLLFSFQNCSPSGSSFVAPKNGAATQNSEVVPDAPAEPPPVPPPSATPSKTLKIAMFGDSTMYGSTLKNGMNVQSPDNVPATVQRLADLEFGSGKVFVENHGVGGSFCRQWLNGNPDPAVKIDWDWQTQVARTDAKIIVINVGINDAFQIDSVQSREDYRQCLYKLADTVQKAGKIFVFQTPNPILIAHNTFVRERRDDMVTVQNIFSGFPIADVYYLPLNWSSLLPDGVHPNDAGYRQIGENLYSHLRATFAAQLN